MNKISLVTIGAILLMGSLSIIGVQQVYAIHATDGVADDEEEEEASAEEEAVAADEEEESNDNNGGDGLKVKVHFDRRDNACVRTADDSHRAGCSPGQVGDVVTFQFNSGT